MLLEVVGMCKKIGQKIPPLKRSKLSKKVQEDEGNIKIILTEANQEWCD